MENNKNNAKENLKNENSLDSKDNEQNNQETNFSSDSSESPSLAEESNQTTNEEFVIPFRRRRRRSSSLFNEEDFDKIKNSSTESNRNLRESDEVSNEQELSNHLENLSDDLTNIDNKEVNENEFTSSSKTTISDIFLNSQDSKETKDNIHETENKKETSFSSNIEENSNSQEEVENLNVLQDEDEKLELETVSETTDSLNEPEETITLIEEESGLDGLEPLSEVIDLAEEEIESEVFEFEENINHESGSKNLEPKITFDSLTSLIESEQENSMENEEVSEPIDLIDVELSEPISDINVDQLELETNESNQQVDNLDQDVESNEEIQESNVTYLDFDKTIDYTDSVETQPQEEPIQETSYISHPEDLARTIDDSQLPEFNNTVNYDEEITGELINESIPVESEINQIPQEEVKPKEGFFTRFINRFKRKNVEEEPEPLFYNDESVIPPIDLEEKRDYQTTNIETIGQADYLAQTIPESDNVQPLYPESTDTEITGELLPAQDNLEETVLEEETINENDSESSNISENIPESEILDQYDQIIEAQKNKFEDTSEFEAASYEDLARSYPTDESYISRPQKITFDQLTTLVEIIEDDYEQSRSSEETDIYRPTEEELIIEDTTAATGLPRLLNILDDFENQEIESQDQTEYDYQLQEIQENENSIEGAVDNFISEIIPESKREVININISGKLDEPQTYSQTDLLRELEEGKYPETIEETSNNLESDFIGPESGPFIAPNRRRRKRKNREKLNIDIITQSELEKRNQEAFSDFNDVVSTEAAQENSSVTSKRRKETKRLIRRQEKLQRERVNNQTREMTQNLKSVETTDEELVFTKVPPNVLKGGITLFNNLARQMQNNGALRVESLMSVLGSLAGYATQAAAREKLINRLRLSEDQVFSVVTTTDGSKYYFGDTIDRALQKDKHSVWYMTATAVYNLTGKVDTNIDEIVRYSTRNLGKPTFGIPRIAKNLKPSHLPQYYVEHMWSALVPGLERFSDDPMDWPIIFGVALQRALIVTRGILDPNVSLRIILESAVPMSITSVNPIELSTSQNKEEAEAQLINQLLTEIDVIRQTLSDQNLTKDQKLSLFEELSQKNEKLTTLLSH